MKNALANWICEESVGDHIPDVPNGPLFQAWSRMRDEETERERQVHVDLMRALVLPDARTGPVALTLREEIRSRMNGHDVATHDLFEWTRAGLERKGIVAQPESIYTAIKRERHGLLIFDGKGKYRRNHASR